MKSAPYRFVYRDEGIEPSGDALEFRLTYEGKLASTRQRPEAGQIDGRADHKHEIRKRFHAQLKRHWETHPGLKLRQYIPYPRGFGGFLLHDVGVVGSWDPPPDRVTWFESAASEFESDGFRWLPLVRKDGNLNCELKILYLRKNARDGLMPSRADIDNRIKTLVDALKLPARNELPKGISPDDSENPFFVLLEDDSLITHLSVETDELLEPTDESLGDTDSRIIVSVRVWPYAATHTNLAFL